MNKYQHYIYVRGEVLLTPRGTTTAVATLTTNNQSVRSKCVLIDKCFDKSVL